MSWQAYIDTSLVGTGNVDDAAIFSANGKDNWAHSKDFKINPDEMTVILDALKDSSHIFAEGFKVNGEKFTVINATDRSVWAKKGKQGMIIVKTTQALLLAHHPDTVPTQSCVATVESLADYLISVGY